MKKYIGVKLILATVMSAIEYNIKRGFGSTPDDEGKEGYMVEYVDSPNANTNFSPYYVSWSPKDVFEKAYRPTDEMTFGLAIEALKTGHNVARKGWNGKGMHLFLANGEDTANSLFKEDVIVDNFIVMKTASGSLQPGWLASQADMLAEDWVVVV